MATVIDGNGGEPLPDATVVVEGARIAAVGPSASTAPDGARVIDGAGKFLTPGFVDTNVHTSLYGAGFGKHRKENASVTFSLIADSDLSLWEEQFSGDRPHLNSCHAESSRY
ncbi:MAG: hypothetical protein OXI39_03455 [Gemmatimonadota bacterium]|uniref:amidohydrolase family protein n=1 Tax=Candidatus Palauibacter scopulicola TaxID=3056741 RepID=UPI0023A68120|nr:hypothetical protein [Candidatus Palauibacter scopulicola]MDE2662048.1 hypothetical protein [Candidatus Palauibacter scopulicola]